MVKENHDGVVRADKGHYAFFMESVSIEYEVQRFCRLTQVGEMLDDKGYGIAMIKSKYVGRDLQKPTYVVHIHTYGSTYIHLYYLLLLSHHILCGVWYRGNVLT